jgi:putative ABC transport system permease protein
MSADLLADLRHAIRALSRAPVYTVTAVLTLALGIGATTAAYSVVGHVLLDPLPYDHPDQLVNVWSAVPQADKIPPSYPDFADYRAQSGAFVGMAFETGGPVTVRRTSGAFQMLAANVTEDFFSVLSATPTIGRTLVRADFIPGAAPAAVLSYGAWVTNFGSDPQVIGRTIDTDVGSYTIVGVLRRGQAYPDWSPGLHTDIYVPLNTIAHIQAALRNRGNHADSRTLARLQPGITVDAARRQLSVVASRLAAAYPATDSGFVGNVTPLQDSVVGAVRPALGILMAAVVLVFLLAIADVANLTLVRGMARSRELGVRAAMGAGPRRLARFLMGENVLIAAFAAVLGIALARVAVRLLVAVSPGDIPRLDEVTVDASAVLVAIAAAVVAVLLCGLAPLVTLRPAQLVGMLKSASRATSGTRSGLRLRSGIVVGQLALSMVLVAGAGLLVRSFAKLRSVDVGFEPSHLVVWFMSGPRTPELADPAVRFELMKRELAAAIVPGVVSGALVNHAPFGFAGVGSSVGVDGKDPAADTVGVGYVTITPHYFATMSIPLVRGRDFTDADMTPNAAVAIISSAMARRYWPDGTDPLDRELTVLNGAPYDPEYRKPIQVRVIGIVGDVRRDPTADKPDPLIYMPFTRPVWGGANVVLRTAGPPAAILPAVRHAGATVDPDVTVSDMSTAREQLDEEMAEQRFTTTILGAFSLVALLLASLGLYGVLAYAVTQRVPEIGIRMALGARGEEVVGLIVRNAARLAATGLVLGVGGAVLFARAMRSLLFGVTPLDPLTFVGVTAVLGTVALLASYLPARRAAGVDPVTALRSE